MRYDGVRFTIFDSGNSEGFRSNQILRVAADPDGGLWVGTSGGPMRYHNGAFGPAPVRALPKVSPGPEHTDLIDAGVDRAGGRWRFARDRLIRERGGEVIIYDAQEFLRARHIRTMLIDREGAIWIGTNSNGLFRVVPRFLTAFAEDEGLSQPNVYPILEDRHGTIWTGGTNDLFRFTDGRFVSQVLETQVRSLYEDRRGRLLVGGGGVVLILENGRVVERIEGFAGAIDVMLEDRAGDLWLGTPRGLIRRGAAGQQTYGLADGLPDAGITALLQDRQGQLWVGTRQGIARLEGDRFTAMTSRDGVGAGRIRALYEDADGTLWAGTFESGITRIRNGRATTITTRAGLFNNGAFHIAEDARGYFWVSSNRGIYRVSRRQLNDYADGRAAAVSAVAYGSQDGMRSAECNGGRQPAGVKARDGSIWFPTQHGVVKIDPSAVPYNTQPPIVTIEDLFIDGARTPFAGGIRLKPGQGDLEISYTAPSSLKAEHMHFKYALEGLSGAWIDAGTRRSVHYSHLPPGSYTFKVLAANSDGVWSEAPAVVAVRIEPFFYQTWWFFGLSIAAIAALTAAGYVLRVRRLVAHARLHAMATADGLTGVANRRRFDAFLQQEWNRARRAASPVSVLLLDVDHFKLFNDTRGHGAGDDCLRAIANLLSGTVTRSTDIVARYGGEEFAVVLADTDEAGAELVAELIRDTIAGAGIPHGASPVAPHVTVSIGVATMVPEAEVDSKELVEAADRALYQAKREGRNRVSAGAASLKACVTEPS